MAVLSVYVVGPSDTKEHEHWTRDLSKFLSMELADFEVRLPVAAEELQGRLLQVVTSEVKLALKKASERRHLEREASLKFQVCISSPGSTGLLSYLYRVDIDPFNLSCTGCDGSLLATGAARPEP